MMRKSQSRVDAVGMEDNRLVVGLEDEDADVDADADVASVHSCYVIVLSVVRQPMVSRY
jgi:hypothetical protein